MRPRNMPRRWPRLFAGSDIPDRYLLWFQHIAWDHKMKSGRSLWDELIVHYDTGIAAGRARCARPGRR